MIAQEPDSSPPPTFDVLPLSDELRKSVADLGYVHPTPVQRAVFGPAKSGRDLVVQARTGTGKTAAFGLPLVDALVRADKACVQALVLCPTRELALQVTREFEGLGKHSQVRTVAVYGGAPMPRQIEAIKQGPQLLVGTPGRVLDHLRRGTLDASTLKVVVLDESDEMLSMGFLPQITDILSFLPEAHQTLLFSATLPPDIRRVADTRLKDPEYITLSGDHIGALEIDHFVYLSRGDKAAELTKIIEIENPESAIVFCNTKDETKRVAGILKSQGFGADWLNADLAQSDRESVMKATREGRLRFLVATDVAARGIDVSHVTHVINHDFPESPEGYVHRTGRTGRAGRTGTAISLVAPSDIGNLYMLRLTYKLRPIERQLPSAQEERTRAQADLLQVFVDAYAKRTHHKDDVALARRVLTHDQAEFILAGLLRDHLGARADIQEEASAARRAKNPPVMSPRDPRETHRPGRVGAARGPRPPHEGRRDPKRSPSNGAGAPLVEDVAVAAASAEPAPVVPPSAAEPREAVAARASAPESPATPAAVGASDIVTPPVREGGLAEVFVSLGKRDGIEPGDVGNLLVEQGFEPDEIAYIRVRQTNTFVGVPVDLLRRTVNALDGATINGLAAQANPARGRGPRR